MNTYPTYQAAKIANPDSGIYKLGGKFTTNSSSEFGHSLQPANPADYCMKGEDFFSKGIKLSVGDSIIESNGNIAIELTECGAKILNSHQDSVAFIIKSEAIELDNIAKKNFEHYKKEPTIEPKYRYEKVTDSIFDLKAEFERGQLLYLDVDDKHYSIETEKQLVNCFDSDCVYRRIEVTERELFIEKSCEIIRTSAKEDILIIGKMFDAGCRFVNGKE